MTKSSLPSSPKTETNLPSSTDPISPSSPPQTSVDDLVRRSEEAAKELNTKLSLGLLGKRETESWQEFEDRAVQMFRDKGLFKNEQV